MKIIYLFLITINLCSCESKVILDLVKINQESQNNNNPSDNQPKDYDYYIARFEDTSKAFMSVEVDWDRKIIYAGSTSAAECLTLISFSDIDNLHIISEVNNTSARLQLEGSCRNLKLYDNYSKLLVSANGANRLLRYDLGSTPEDPTSWEINVAQFSASGGTYARQIQHAVTNGITTQVYFSVYSGWFHVELNELSHNFTELAKHTSMSSNNTALFLLNDDLVLAQRYSSSTANINVMELADGSTSSVGGGLIRNANGSTNNIWTSASSEDGTKHVLMGQFVAFIDSSSGSPVITKREKSVSGIYRVSKFVKHNDKDFIYAISSNNRLDVYDITNISYPKLISQTVLSELGSYEAYGIDVNTDENLAIIGTDKGVINFIDIRGLNSPFQENLFIPEITISDSVLGNSESMGHVDITVSLNAPTTIDVDVNWTTSDGTATAPSDYTSDSGTITFSAGETSKTISVALIDDGATEGVESFEVILSSPLNGVIIDDRGDVSFSD